jgi:predicted Fe-Mo cluster-binding NifX family protein/predicted DNA-binding protein (UPF0251 family)
MILLNVDEYETVRLIDYLGMTQEQCAARMGVARGTVQSLYDMARTKISRFLVEGTSLKISGGSYELCSSEECRKLKEEVDCQNKDQDAWKDTIKIAVTYEQGRVFQHFGHSGQFKLYEVAHGRITSMEVVDTNGSGHGELAAFLKNKGVDVVICGGIGAGAKNALSEAEIRLFAGAAGNADDQVKSFLEGSLSYNPNTECNHHGHQNEEKCKGC